MLFNEFVAIFDVWEQARPYLFLMVDETEMHLVVSMAHQHLDLQQVSDLLAMPNAEAADLLERAYSRCIVDKVIEDGLTKYKISDFYARLGSLCQVRELVRYPGRRSESHRSAFSG